MDWNEIVLFGYQNLSIFRSFSTKLFVSLAMLKTILFSFLPIFAIGSLILILFQIMEICFMISVGHFVPQPFNTILMVSWENYISLVEVIGLVEINGLVDLDLWSIFNYILKLLSQNVHAFFEVILVFLHIEQTECLLNCKQFLLVFSWNTNVLIIFLDIVLAFLVFVFKTQCVLFIFFFQLIRCSKIAYDFQITQRTDPTVFRFLFDIVIEQNIVFDQNDDDFDHFFEFLFEIELIDFKVTEELTIVAIEQIRIAFVVDYIFITFTEIRIKIDSICKPILSILEFELQN